MLILKFSIEKKYDNNFIIYFLNDLKQFFNIFINITISQLLL